MQKKRLGKSDLYVTPIGLGCMGFSHAYGAPLEKREAVKRIREAYETGYNFFDTAECYTGKALHDLRDKVVIATKFGVTITPAGLKTDSRKATILRSCESSLKKLNTDCIDLYYQHRIDPSTSPKEVGETINRLIAEGKIRCFGVSEANEEYLRKLSAICPVTAIQNRFSMMARWHESLFSALEELQISFVAFSPLANGFLNGTYTASTRFKDSSDYRNRMPQYTEQGLHKAERLVSVLKEIAREKGATPGQISLSWILKTRPYLIPIPGSRKTERNRENFEAVNFELSDEEFNTLNP